MLILAEDELLYLNEGEWDAIPIAQQGINYQNSRMRLGCVWMPLHFGESNINYLTNDAGDPVTGTAEYKVCAVRVEALEEASAAE